MPDVGKQLELFGAPVDGTAVGVRLNASAAARRQEHQIREQASTLARRDDPSTSKTAAREVVESGKLTDRQRKVLAAVCLHPGSTYGELAHYAELDAPEPARRLPELARLGYVRTITGANQKTFERPCRIRGTKCRPWWPTALGQQASQNRDL